MYTAVGISSDGESHWRCLGRSPQSTDSLHILFQSTVPSSLCPGGTCTQCARWSLKVACSHCDPGSCSELTAQGLALQPAHSTSCPVPPPLPWPWTHVPFLAACGLRDQKPRLTGLHHPRRALSLHLPHRQTVGHVLPSYRQRRQHHMQTNLAEHPELQNIPPAQQEKFSLSPVLSTLLLLFPKGVTCTRLLKTYLLALACSVSG